jgi:hypothetical protein
MAEQPRAERPALDVAHRARVVVGQEGLRAVALDRGLDPLGRAAQGFVPRDALEAALALPAHPAQRVQETVG